jgi:hypothetical protein
MTFSFFVEFVIVRSLLCAIAVWAIWVARYFYRIILGSFYFDLTDLIYLENELFFS